MKRVLLICYYFPPLGGAGVARPLALYKLLPRFGYECDVLTVKPVAYRVYEPELLDGVDQARIYRSGSHDPQRLMYLLGMRTVKDTFIDKARRAGERMFPDPKKGWVKPAVRLGRVLAENRQYHAVITTSPPISSHLVGLKLAEEFHLPWVADFRDFWTLYKAEDWFESRRLVAKARELLKSVSERASEITVVNPAISDYLGRGRVVFNSYDSERAALWSLPKDSNQFRIGILGTLDDLRPVAPLFATLAKIRETRPELLENVKLVQVGPVQIDNWDAMVDQFGMRGMIDQYPRTARAETIRILSETSALYLGLADSAAGVLPIRVFDMLASGRALLVCAPTGSVVREIVSQIPNSFVFTVDQTEPAAEYLSRLIESSLNGKLDIGPNPEYARKYSSGHMVHEFANLLDSIAAPTIT